MKNILFIIIATLAIVGCSNDDEEPTELIAVNGEWLAKDSTHFYVTINGNNQNDSKFLLTKRRRDNYKIVWKKEMVQPAPIKIDMGYGEQKNVDFNYSHFAFDTDELILVNWETQLGSLKFPYRYIGIYSIDGEFIKNVNIESADPSFVRWMDNKIIIPLITSITIENNYKRKDSYIILDEKGNIIESKENVSLFRVKDPQYTWNKGYISYSQSEFIICNLDKGTAFFNINDIIANKYPQETNKPKTAIENVSFSIDIATINVSTTFYNGEKRKDTIKINFITHEVID